MTERINSFLVILKDDQREDDAEGLRTALLQLKGVLSVTANVVDGISDVVAERRVRRELGDVLLAVLYQVKS